MEHFFLKKSCKLIYLKLPKTNYFSLNCFREKRRRKLRTHINISDVKHEKKVKSPEIVIPQKLLFFTLSFIKTIICSRFFFSLKMLQKRDLPKSVPCSNKEKLFAYANM